MHITVLTHNYPRFPGDFSGTFVESLCEELSVQGERVTVWAPYDPAYQLPSENSLAENPPSGVELRLYRYMWPQWLHRLGYMRSMQSDLSLRTDSYLLGPLMVLSGIVHLLLAALRDRPDVLHAHWLLPNGFIGAVVSRVLGIPLVISVPGSDARVADLNPLFRAMAVFSLRQASLLTANSEELRDAVAAASSLLAPANLREEVLDKFDLILYGTNPQALRPDPTGVDELRQQLRIPAPGSDSPVVFLCVGRMVYKKGFDVLIRALAEPALRQQNVVAVMVGDGDQRAEWQALADELGVAHKLRWTGNVPVDQIRVYYNLCDVLINPAVHKPADGLNVCVLDAMSCAKPVVGSNVQGNPLAIVDGKSGLLVPEADPAALADALATLVTDEALRRRMGRASRERIENELGWPHLARRYIAHFSRLSAPTHDGGASAAHS